ncbi:MAG: hypothetical protein RR523_11845 [Cetobacterium sp.]
MLYFFQLRKEKKLILIILAKIHISILIFTLFGGIIEKIFNFNFNLFRIIGILYFIIGNISYTLIFKILSKNKVIITKATSGFQNKVYYFSSTITMLILLLGIIRFFL